MTAAARRPASPYARRLARERGFALELISGSGPDGRIVAADVEAFALRQASAPQRAAAATTTFATTVALGAVQALLAGLGATDTGIDLDDFLVRAAARALEAALPGENGPIIVALESGPGEHPVSVKDAHLGLVSRLHTQLAEAASATGQGASPPHLTLRRIAYAGMRATSLPTRAGAALRLVVFATHDAAEGEASLAFDAEQVREDAAAAILTKFREGLEAPLTLLA